jgi:hypothetical protein
LPLGLLDNELDWTAGKTISKETSSTSPAQTGKQKQKSTRLVAVSNGAKK